jgi:hypothetical protein
MEFPSVKVKGVKANFAAGEINLTFSAPLNDELLEMAEQLAVYAGKDMGYVELRIIPQQPPLVGVEMKTFQAEPAAKASPEEA